MDQTPTIIFVCEHGAAKSIVAATYFNQLAEEIGLKARAVARGTNPEKELSPQAAKGLSQDHLTPAEAIPQKLTKADLRSAWHVITFCELPVEYQQHAMVEYWKDIPPVGESYEMARDAILERLNHFVDQIR